MSSNTTLPRETQQQERTITIQVHRLAHAPEALPFYATPGSAGMDLRAAITEPLTLNPMARTLVPTGLIMMIPEGHECQVRPRSGLSIKHGITLINCVGTIDSDYRDEVKVPLVNLSDKPFVIDPGERVAQMIIAPITQGRWSEVSLETITKDKQRLMDSGGRQGGFGSTGTR